MADDPAGVLDVRVELETALAPLVDLVRENNALLRAVVDDLAKLLLTAEAPARTEH